MGARRQWQCTACNHSFACNQESLPAPGHDAVCPHCGAANDPAQGRDLPGQRIWVDRTAFAWRSPQRWETVVFRLPDDPRVLGVKRVVGLPGEVVDLAAGDVLVNGRVAAKQPPVERSMAVELADATDAPRRWHADDPSAWTWRQACFVHDPRTSGSIDWLEYRHFEPLVRAAAAGAILDGSAYDQSESRRLNQVADFALRCRLRMSDPGVVYLRARSRGEVFLVTLDTAAREASLSHNGRRVIRRPWTVDARQEFAPIEFALADHRVRLALDGTTLWQYDFEPRQTDRPAAAPLAIGAGATRVEVADLRVFRDVYYTESAGGQYRLGPEEYFVLGDNSAPLGGQPQLGGWRLGRFAVGSGAGMVG